MDGHIFANLVNHVLRVIDSRLGGEFHSVRVYGPNDDGRHLRFQVTHAPTQHALPVCVDLGFLSSLTAKKRALWFDNLIHGIEKGFSDGWATSGSNSYRWMDDGSVSVPPAPPTHNSSHWLPAQDWQATQAAWVANHSNITEERKQKLSKIAAILERRFFGGVDVSFTINSHSSGRVECQACFKHFGNRKVSKEIFTEAILSQPIAILSQPILLTVENIYNDIAEFAHRNFDDVDIYDAKPQTQELDPQEEFGGPDWADEKKSSKSIAIRVSGWKTVNATLQELKGKLPMAIKEAMSNATYPEFYSGADFGFSTQNARAPASKKKPVSSKKNDGKAKGMKKK